MTTRNQPILASIVIRNDDGELECSETVVLDAVARYFNTNGKKSRKNLLDALESSHKEVVKRIKRMHTGLFRRKKANKSIKLVVGPCGAEPIRRLSSGQYASSDTEIEKVFEGLVAKAKPSVSAKGKKAKL